MDKKHSADSALLAAPSGASSELRYWTAFEPTAWKAADLDQRVRHTDRLPEHFRRHQHVVNNWREHHLRPPPC